MAREHASFNSSELSESVDSSNNQFGYRTKTLNVNDENVQSLNDEALLSHFKTSENILKGFEKNFIKFMDEKLIIIKELIHRYQKYSSHDCKSIINQKIMGSLIERLSSENILIIRIMENYLERINILELYKDIIAEESLGACLNIDDKIQGATADGITMMTRLNNFESNRKDGRAVKNKYDFIVEVIKGELDDAIAENQVLKTVLLRQTKLISELSFEKRQLNSIKRTQCEEESSPVISSLSSGIEPLVRICEKYRTEYRRSVRSLETLLNQFKLQESSKSPVLENHLSETVEYCENAIRCLTSVNINSFNESSRAQLASSIQAVRLIRSRLLHLLAKIGCDESDV